MTLGLRVRYSVGIVPCLLDEQIAAVEQASTFPYVGSNFATQPHLLGNRSRPPLVRWEAIYVHDCSRVLEFPMLRISPPATAVPKFHGHCELVLFPYDDLRTMQCSQHV